MTYGLWLSAAGMQAQMSRVDVIANNLANASTTGFKRDLLMMQERPNEVNADPAMSGLRVPVLDQESGGVTPGNSAIDLSQAPLEQTGNPTDLALEGKGFFTVAGKGSEKLLTRDGKFLLNASGTLVTAVDGRAVLGADGKPITMNPAVKPLIDSNGAIRQGDAVVGQLGVVSVTDPRQLTKVGGNLLAVAKQDALGPMPAATQVRQGSIETSGVNPTVEMVNLMEGQRAFEANARMMTYQDTMLADLNTIGKVA